jgi:predicted PurR-regulated permease PerM
MIAAGEFSFMSAWMVLGAITGYLNLLPYIGVPVGGVMAALLGIMTYQLENLWLYPALLATVAAGVTVDHKVLTPVVIGQSIKVYELFVYFAIYFGAAAGGIVGVILALPAMTVISECIRHFYRHWLLHRHEERRQQESAAAPASSL